MFTYPFGEVAAARVQRLRLQRDYAFGRAVEATYRGLPNEIALVEHVRGSTGLASGHVTPLACNLPLRRRAARATMRMLRSAVDEGERLTLVGFSRASWATSVWEPSLPLGRICCEAHEFLFPHFASLIAVVRLVAGERQSPFLAPWDYSADVIAICWRARNDEVDLQAADGDSVTEIALNGDHLQAAVASLWELSGSDLSAYAWHKDDVVGHPLSRRLQTPVARAYQALSTSGLRELVVARNAGERVLTTIGA